MLTQPKPSKHREQYVDPALKNEYISHIRSIELLDVHRAGSTLPFPFQDPYGFVEKISMRFDESVPIVSKMIRNSFSKLNQVKPVALPHAIEEVIDEKYINEIDSENCVIASLSRVKSKGIFFEYTTDQRIWDHAKTILQPNDLDLMKAVLLLSDSIYLNTVIRGVPNRLAAQMLTSRVISKQSSISQMDFFLGFLDLGFLGREDLPSKDLKNFYVWDLINDIYDHLWNKMGSVYLSFEREVISEVIKRISGMSGCLFFARSNREGFTSDKIKETYDCRELLERGIYFYGHTFSSEDQKEAQVLLEKYYGYKKMMQIRLFIAYEEKWQKLILSIPVIPEKILQEIDSILLSFINGDMLQVFDPNDPQSQTLPAKELKFIHFPIDLNF